MASPASTQRRSRTRSSTAGPVGAATASLQGRLDLAADNKHQETAVPLSSTDASTEPEPTVRFVPDPITINDNTDRTRSQTRSTHGRRSDRPTDTETVTSETSPSRGHTRDTQAETVDRDTRTLRSTLAHPSTQTRKMTYSSPSTLPSHAATTDSDGAAALDLPSTLVGTNFPQTALRTRLPLDTEPTHTDTFRPSTDAETSRKPLSTIPLSTSKPTGIPQTTLAPKTSVPETARETDNAPLPRSTLSPGTDQGLGATRGRQTSFLPASELNTARTIPHTETVVSNQRTATVQTDAETAPSRWTQWRRRIGGLVVMNYVITRIGVVADYPLEVYIYMSKE